VESPADVAAADAAMLEMELAAGLPEGGLRIHAMIESARGLLASPQIAAASPRMAALVFGSADYASDIGCRPGEDRAEMAFALQQIVVAARAVGIDAIDAPCFDVRNVELLRREAEAARRLGFDGKNALHPDQLEILNEVFGVTPEEAAWAHKVLAELESAEGRGRSLSLLDGQLIDDPHRAAARRILAREAAAREGGSGGLR
jgi:citrate lyase beta subunit